MANSAAPFQVLPGRGLGYITLGASLHNVLTRLKAQPAAYPSLDFSYSSSEPVLHPVVLNLSANGIRMRFDGPDQRLRLIEVLDFTKTSFSYKNTELVRRFKSPSESSKEQEAPQTGPSFRHIYNRLFGPSYPGEYVPPAPNEKSGLGTYVLSYPGIAFSFPLQHSKWSADADFVSLLSSSAALPAKSMAVFQSSSWSEARNDLFTKAPQFPRSISLTGRSKDLVADEVEQMRIKGGGVIEVVRRNSSTFTIHLSETTPQDLVAELGPPDAIYRKYDSKIAIHGEQRGSQSTFRLVNGGDAIESSDPLESTSGSTSRGSSTTTMPTECFYNYFHHGFDVLISPPGELSPSFPNSSGDTELRSTQPASQLTATKILLHGNVPGSYPFNRHRRCRWIVDVGASGDEALDSEMRFSQISTALRGVWKGSYANSEEEKSLQRGMVLNRGWGESPDSSLELLGGWEDSPATGQEHALADGVSGLGNTELFGFPGLLFEVLKSGTVSCLTVY